MNEISTINDKGSGCFNKSRAIPLFQDALKNLSSKNISHPKKNTNI